MAILVRITVMSILAVLINGCMNSSKGGFWLTEKDLNAYRKRGGIEVSSPDGLYNGILEKVPTNRWKNVQLPRMQISIEIPESLQIGDMPERNGLSLYIIHSHYPDARYGADISMRKKTKERYEEDLKRQQEGVVDWRTEGQRDKRWIDLWEWRCIQFHPALDVNDMGTLYRRDIRFSDGAVLEIEGNMAKLTDRNTAMSLYPEMNAVVRRIINSIEPLNVTTNK
jgi:hypothetical protein